MRLRLGSIQKMVNHISEESSMKSFSYMVRVLFLCFLSVCSVSCPLSAMMPGSFSEEAWDELVIQGKYKKLWEAQVNLTGAEHLERASDWRVKRINEFFELTIILAELRHWSKNGHLEDPVAKNKRVEWLLKAWMMGFIRIVTDENTRLEGKAYSSLSDLWKYYFEKYLRKDSTDSFWVAAYQKAKEEMINRINADRDTIEEDEDVLRDQSVLPNCEAVCMIKEEPVLWGFRGSTFTFARTQDEAAKFFPSTLRELHEKRVAVLGEAWESLEIFGES